MNRAPALAAVLLVACGSSNDAGPPPVAYDGALPAKLDARFSANVLVVPASVNGAAARPLVVDTGAAMTGVDPAAFADARLPSDASSLGTLAVGALTFRDVPSVALSECGADCGPFDVTGVIGGNVLRSFVVSFDYRGPSVTLGDAPPPAGLVEPAIVVPCDLLGGGSGTIAGGNGRVVDVPATRLVIAATIDGTARTLVVDTGASYTLLRQSVFSALVADGRATLDLQSATANGSASGRVARARTIAAGDAHAAGSPIASVDDAFMDNLNAETGRAIDGLLGGAFLRAFHTMVGYDQRRLTLRAYAAADPLADEFDRIGVFLAPSGGGYAVAQVVPGSQAAGASLAGATIVDVDGQALAGLDPEAADRLLRGAPGAMHTLHVRRSGGAVDAVTLPTEDVLPLR